MIYNLIRTLLYIPLVIISIFKPKLRKFITKRIFQSVKIKNRDNIIWIHCASVGEVNLAEPIIKKILEETTDNILITMMTDTGRKTAEDKYKKNNLENKNNLKNRVNILYFPLDDYFGIKKILNQINLKKLVIVETEIWPNLINMASKKAKVMMINGRISNKSIKSYTKVRFILKKLFRNIDTFIMQTEEDKNRIISLGANEKKTYNYGNLKFNINIPNYGKNELEELKNMLNITNEKVWTAGSTRDDEEEYILEAFDKLVEESENINKSKEELILIIVPRHIERTDDICNRLLQKYDYIKYSDLEKNKSINNFSENIKEESNKKAKVIIVDKIGVLRKLYAISDVAYVGGTLVNIGGHSLLEPLFYRKTPIFGPYLQNVKDIAREVLEKEIGKKVENTEELVEAVKISLGYKNNLNNRKESSEKRIEKFFEENSHTVELTFEKLTSK